MGNRAIARLLASGGTPRSVSRPSVPSKAADRAHSVVQVQRQDQDEAAPLQTDEDARGEFDQGRAAYEGGNYQEALRHFEAASQVPGLESSRMAYLIWNMANAKARLGDIDGAMTEAMTYGQYSSDPPASRLIEQIERIGAEQSGGQEPAAAAQTDEEARAEFEQGQAAYEAGNYQEALRHFEAATQAPGLGLRACRA